VERAPRLLSRDLDDLDTCVRLTQSSAELLRRSHVSQRQASRSVAGPAPPPSWRESAPNRSGSSRQVEPIQAIQPATAADLRHSSDLFSLTHRDLTSPTRSHRSTGPPGLVEHGLMAVLRHLEDERVVYLPTDEIQVDQTQVPPSSDSGSNEEITLGALLREQVAYLEPHLKAALLDLASMIPEGSSRLTDRGLGAILNSPPESMDELDPIPDHDDKDNDATSWDEPTSSTVLHHLPLTLHSSPLSFIRQLPSFPGISLTSLNLAYCTITNLDRLVSALPSSLRELGLAGVRLPHKDAQENWRRGTASLGRKFIVLTMLDLSFPPVEITPGLLAGMMHPPKSRLPSLRLLGLRGRSTGSAAQSGGDVSCADQTGSAGESAAVEVRRALAAVVRGQGRQRYVDIIWE
jgi:hypothetical protein